MNLEQLHRPPKWADRFLEWYCDRELVNEIQGDLHEMFHIRAAKKGRFLAQLLFIWEVFRSFKASNLKSDPQSRFSYFHMINNIYRLAIRNLLKHKFYSFIKVTGLAIGLASVILISSFVYNELHFDQFHEDADHIYRITELITNNEGVVEEYSASIPFPYGPTFQSDFPETSVVRLYQTFQKIPLLRYEETQKSFYEEGLFFTDSTFFDVFSFELKQGNPATVLDNPRSLVITESMAKKYFDQEDPVGKTLLFENNVPLIITGVAKDPPLNSHFRFDFLASMQNTNEILEASGNTFGSTGWYWNPVHTYVRTPTEMSQARLEEMIGEFNQRHLSERMISMLEFPLQRLTDIHLNSQLYQEITRNGDSKTIYISIAIAAFIIIIATINFMNLTAARSSQRAKEAAIRKVLGSGKKLLIYQFLTESVITAFMSLFLAVGLISVFISPFEYITDTPINFEVILHPAFIGAILLFTLLLGVLAGLYPAFLITRFRLVDSLKQGNIKLSGKKSPMLWKALVVFQFAASIILIIGAMVVNKQHKYLLYKDMGFDKERVIMLSIAGTDISTQPDQFKSELLRNSQILHASAMSDILGNDVPLRPFFFEGHERPVNIPGLFADRDFIKTFGLAVSEGRDFSKDLETDKEAFIINKAAAKLWDNSDWDGKHIGWARKGRPVVGLVEDFHFADLKQQIRPLVITYDAGWYAYMAIRVAPGDFVSILDGIEAAWTQFEPDRPFTPFFLDDRLNRIYEGEHKISQMVGYFSMISIFLATLGLFGLANYSALLRVKEIGIRKVLGASTSGILGLMSKDYLILIGIANVIAWPVAWFFSSEWLANFTFKTDLSTWLFIFAGGATIVVSLFTIWFQSLKTARLNPSTTLRNE